MAERAKAAFEFQVYTLPLTAIVPRHTLSPQSIKSSIFKQIKSSIQEIGLIEPLAVFPQDERGFLLVDGHLRFEALRQLGHTEVKVLFSKDDEGYTYNKRVNHIPPVAQHFMILHALKSGVSERRIAVALNVDVVSIRSKARMLDGICPDVVELFKDRHVTAAVFPVLRKMKSAIQIATAELMILRNDYSLAFARTRLDLTPPDLLVNNRNQRKARTDAAAAQFILEDDTEHLIRTLKSVEASYGVDILTLTVSCNYIERLLERPKIARYLERFHSGVFGTFRSLVADIKRPAISADA